jgi:type III secretion apparatus needle protein
MLISSNGSLSLDYINNIGMSALSNKEQSLRATFADSTQELSTVKMLELQSQVQQWSLITSIQSTLAKEVSDTMKAVIQKSG